MKYVRTIEIILLLDFKKWSFVIRVILSYSSHNPLICMWKVPLIPTWRLYLPLSLLVQKCKIFYYYSVIFMVSALISLSPFPCAKYPVWDTHLVHEMPVPCSTYWMPLVFRGDKDSTEALLSNDWLSRPFNYYYYYRH